MVNIRRALPSESQALSDLAFAAKALWGYSDHQLALWRNDLHISAKSIAAEPTFLAEEDGATSGVIQLRTDESVWSIEHLWVHPKAGRRGIGRLLVQHASQYAREHKQGELRIDSDPQAEQFYLRLGARKVGELAAPIEAEPTRVRPQLVLRTSDAA